MKFLQRKPCLLSVLGNQDVRYSNNLTGTTNASSGFKHFNTSTVGFTMFSFIFLLLAFFLNKILALGFARFSILDIIACWVVRTWLWAQSHHGSLFLTFQVTLISINVWKRALYVMTKFYACLWCSLHKALFSSKKSNLSCSLIYSVMSLACAQEVWLRNKWVFEKKYVLLSSLYLFEITLISH